jgi:peptidase M23-like protein
VSSPKYQGRHYAGRHRVSGHRVRLPRAFSSSFVLPTTAAAALVVTATGATVAESAPLTLDLSGQQTAIARTEQVADEATASAIAQRRQASGMQTAALQGRAEAQQRATRAAKRKAAAAAAARAKAEREGKRWVKAIRTASITSGFGARWGKTHDGLDFGAPTGTPLYAMSKGTVILSDNVFSFGNKIEIRYWDGTVTSAAATSRPVTPSCPVTRWAWWATRGTRSVRTCTWRSTRAVATTRSTPIPGSPRRACSDAPPGADPHDLAVTPPRHRGPHTSPHPRRSRARPLAPRASGAAGQIFSSGAKRRTKRLTPSSPPKSTSACVLSPSPRVRTTLPSP